MKKMKSLLTVTLAFVLCVFCMFGCSQGQSSNDTADTTSDANSTTGVMTEEVVTNEVVETPVNEGGVLYLSVNPEIEITYDRDGMVTGVMARNDDALKILANYSGFQNKECRQVVAELVTAIGEAGYLVDEVEGGNREITIEIKEGSGLPSDTFLDNIYSDVRESVNTNGWQSPLEVHGESDYGITDYVDTDYGPENDGVTDYDDTDYGPNNDGVTDYDDTDYGPNNDGVTDYNENDTDYGPNNDGVTDYNDTDYGINNDGVTDYQQPAPTPAPEPTPAPAPAPAPTPAPAPNPSSDYGDSGYSNYDD